MKRFLSLGAIVFSLGLVGPVHSASFLVTPNGDNDCGDNECNFQSALDASEANGQADSIILEAGNYDASNGFAFFGTDNLSVDISGAGPSQTVLVGNGTNPVLSLDLTGAAVDASADLTITGIRFENGRNSTTGGGLAVYTNDADLKVDNCEFFNNQTDATAASANDIGGGGLAFNGLDQGSGILVNSHFEGNTAPESAGAGALLFSVNGNVSVGGNTFVGNSALDIFGGTVGLGGGLAAVSVIGEVKVSRNTFRDNEAGAGAGAVVVAVYGFGTVDNNLVIRNIAIAPSGMESFGGGLGSISVFSEMSVTNNTIVDNRAVNGSGGGLYIVGDAVAKQVVSNNIIWDNSADGPDCSSSSCNDVYISDLLSSTGTEGATIQFNNNDFSDFAAACDPLQGCTPHRDISPATNLNVDPLFVNASLLNFNLSAASPLIDKGSATAPGLGEVDLDGGFRVLGTAPDMGALESPFTAGGGPVPTPTASPGTENCANNVDDDGDTLIDCLDPDCAGAAACQDPPAPPPADDRENCGNNIDDDGNGLTDCADPICVGAVACPAESDDGGSGGNDDGSGGNTVTASGCALAKVESAPTSALYFLLPLSLALILRRRGLPASFNREPRRFP
ncbi:MAG TPA: right-handed parallel beta-helix repeat-containing protein [bacterium]|nr:right-handed parallel beta-helix repeat-containing protein [bacterium]